MPLILGGEHSITPEIINTLAKKYNEITIIHFDAHSDLRNEFYGNKNSHACAMKRCLDNDNVNIISIGIRSSSQEEVDFKDQCDRVKWVNNVSDIVGKNIYISFDVDVFDSSIMPATGTPEPGGLFWNQAIYYLNQITKYNNIIGIDVVEFSPIENIKAYDFMIAKLVYKLIGFSKRDKYE